MRWRSTIGNQRDLAKLGNLIRRKFGPDPLIIMGAVSCTRASRFHTPTKGIGYVKRCISKGFVYSYSMNTERQRHASIVSPLHTHFGTA